MLNALRYRVIRRLLEQVATEVVPYGRNFQTINNDPINFKSYPGIDVDEYMDGDGRYWVEITVDKHPNMSLRPRSFPSQVDADNYIRMNYERIKLILMNHQSS